MIGTGGAGITYMQIYGGLRYRMAGNFRGIQFSRKAHPQRFCDRIFADGRSRVAPPIISYLLLHVRRSSGTAYQQKKQQAIDRSIIYMYSTAHRQLDKRVQVTRAYESPARESISGNRVYRYPRFECTRALARLEGTRKYSRLDSKKLS